MRKHVKPAHPEAAIPDPVRGGDLPPEGLTVDWSVHWARLAQRGDVIVTDADEASSGPAKEKRAGRAPKAAPSKAPAKPKRSPSKIEAPVPAPKGEAPAESGPQIDGDGADATVAPAAPEPPVT